LEKILLAPYDARGESLVDRRVGIRRWIVARAATGWELRETFEYERDVVAHDVFGDGRPVVLVHGTRFSSYVWRRIAPELAENYRVHVFDLLGYGASDKRDGQYVSHHAQGKLLAGLLDHWGLESPMIVGHDFGGAITMRTHLLEGCDFERIVLVDTVSATPWSSPFYRLVQDYPGVFRQIPAYMHRAMVAAYIRDATYRPMTDKEMGPYLAPWLGKEGQDAFYRQIVQNDQRDTAESEPLYRRVERPVFILWGEEDRWLPLGVGEKLNSSIPGSRLETIPECSHLAQEDAPEAVLAHLNAFLSGGP
jgi:pimeloyl-ACP methyl ester carboxylesterase